VKTPKELTFEIAERYVDRVVAVNDEDIAYALDTFAAVGAELRLI
jgi:threonine dehydratase